MQICIETLIADLLTYPVKEHYNVLPLENENFAIKYSFLFNTIKLRRLN